MKYDDSSWHSGNNFPPDLSLEAGATHIGMYVAWCILSGLGGKLHTDERADERNSLQILKDKECTPGQFLIEHCDGKFINDDLNEEGEKFTQAYYGTNQYLVDYEKILGGKQVSLYHVNDSWINFDLLKPILERRLYKWRNSPLKKLLRIFKK